MTNSISVLILKSIFMKLSFLYYIPLLLFVSCGSTKQRTCDLSEYKVKNCRMESHLIDSILVYPESINTLNDKLIIMEPQRKDSLVSIFSCDNFEYVCSSISKGHAKYEMVSLRNDYFSNTDSSFFVLSRNIIKEFLLKKDTIQFVNEHIIKIPDALNHVLRVGRDVYITSGFTDGKGNEHLLYKDGHYSGFGDYAAPALKGNDNFFFNSSISAGTEGKNVIWDFHRCRDLICCYDLQGKLLEEIRIKNTNKKRIKDEHEYCYYKIKWNSSYIAVMYNNSEIGIDGFYELDNEQRPREMQIWTWDGILKQRLTFDIPIDNYCISEEGILYAIISNKPNVIYTYKLDY